MDSNKQSQIEIDSVIKRMKEAVGVGSVAALSKHLGYRSNAIQNTVSRGHVPYKEAALLAMRDGVSMDWLMFGTEPRQRGDRVTVPDRDMGPDPAPYPTGKRTPALFLAETGEPDGAFAERNERAYEVLREVIEGVEVALTQMSVAMAVGKKAELIATLFEIYASAEARPSRNHILRLVRSAS